jgi:hypothetical protein
MLFMHLVVYYKEIKILTVDYSLGTIQMSDQRCLSIKSFSGFGIRSCTKIT